MKDDIPDIDEDIIVKTHKKNHYLIFNLKKVIDHPDFLYYYRIREKNNKITLKSLEKRYGEDLVDHFERGYQVLRMLEKMNFEIYEEDIPDEEL